MRAKKSTKKKNGNGKLRKYLIGGCAIFIVALFILGFLPKIINTKKIDAVADKDCLQPVTILNAKAVDDPIKFILPSTTSAHHITPICSRATGYLKKYYVTIGDIVRKGDLLAELDTPEIEQEYNQAIAELESAKTRLALAKITKDRFVDLFNNSPKAISKQDVDDKEANFISSEADVLASEANVFRIRELLDFKYIFAPFDGIIIQRDIDLGSLVTQGSSGSSPQKLFIIAKTDIIRVFVNVPQFFYRTIHEGVKGNVRIREFQDREFEASVVRYAKALDPASRTMQTELHINNKNGEIAAGLYADVQFSIKPEFPYFIIPIQAMIVRAGPPQVAILDENDVVHIKNIKIGIDTGRTIEVIEGISPNDRIVVNPTENIKDGVKVRITKTT